MKKYQHLFFDLDHTLWDYESNSHDTLKVLFDEYHLEKEGSFSKEDLITAFTQVNYKLWDQYHIGNIDQEHIRRERFISVFEKLELEFQNTDEFSSKYISMCPKMGKTLPGAIELCEYLTKHYSLSIITNGFADIQHIKLNTSGLEKYFDRLIISGHTNYRKPDREIFLYAFEQTGAKAQSSIMIGDSLESDIRGAKNVSMDQVFFNPNKTAHNEVVTYEITRLMDLKEIGL